MSSDLRSKNGNNSYSLSALFFWTTAIAITLGLFINFGIGILVFVFFGFVAVAAADAYNDGKILPFAQLIVAITIFIVWAQPTIGVDSIEHVIVDMVIFTFGGWLAFQAVRYGSWPTRMIGIVTSTFYVVVFLVLVVLWSLG